MTLSLAKALRKEGKHEEAKTLLVSLAALSPQDAELQYEAACVHDFLGFESQAIPFYLAVLGGALQRESRLGAYLGLGSTYRILGRYDEAASTLRAGLAEFPDANELKAFLAMADHNLGNSKGAVEALLELLAATSSDEGIRRYSKAIEYYAKNVERVSPPCDLPNHHLSTTDQAKSGDAEVSGER
jgi:tetratricopeptide (TPR) repeat protein